LKAFCKCALGVRLIEKKLYTNVQLSQTHWKLSAKCPIQLDTLKAFNKHGIPSNPFTLATFLISPNYLPLDSRCPHFVIENLPGSNSILPHTKKKKNLQGSNIKVSFVVSRATNSSPRRETRVAFPAP
jgi:hypothetical protein